MFGFFNIVCEWKLFFEKIIISVKSERKYNIHKFWDVGRYLLAKTEYFGRQGCKFSHICDMKTTFISDFRNWTCRHYLIQPKSMIEWKLNEKLSRNPELIKTFRNISHPLIRKYKYVFPPEENQDLI